MISGNSREVASTDVLGAALSVDVDAHPVAAESVARAVHDEVARLNRIFAPADRDSEFSRWRAGRDGGARMSPDLAKVLAASERFWVFSKGAFHPGAAPLVNRWREAEASGVPPTASEMRAMAARLELPYTAVSGPVRRTGDCSHVDLSSIARGYILDCALEAGWRLGLASALTVDAAGDQRHRGAGGVRIALGDLSRLWPAAPTLETIRLKDAALSRSSRPRSAFHVGAQHYRNVLDTRSGWPNDEIVAVAALAPDSMTADVLATVVGSGAAGAASLPGCAWLAVHADGAVERSDGWPHVGATTIVGG